MNFEEIRAWVDRRKTGARTAQTSAKKVRRSSLGAKGKRDPRKRGAVTRALSLFLYRSSRPFALAQHNQ